MMDSRSELLEQKIEDSAERRRECDPCKERGETVVGLKLCKDCQEVYCKTCTDSHNAFKKLKDHRLVDIKKIHSVANRADIITSSTKCAIHPEKDVELFCKTHDVIMCVTCVANDYDKSCEIVDVSRHGIDDAYLREESYMLKTRMQAAVDHLELLNTVAEKNKKDLKKKLKEINQNVIQVRDQVVTMMDNVVKHVSEITQQIESENEDRLDEDMSRMSKIQEVTEENAAFLDAIRQHRSERHFFISAHQMKTQFEGIGRKISEEDKLLRKIDAELKIADDLRKFIEDAAVEKLVHVNVNETENGHKQFCDVTNYLRDRNLVLVEEHIVSPNVKHPPCFDGVSMLKDGRVILSDICSERECGYICVYDPTNKTTKKVQMNSPNCAVQLDDTHIAVVLPRESRVGIVSVRNKLRVKNTFNVHKKPRSIVAFNDDQLAVGWMDPPAFSFIDISATEPVWTSYFDQDKSGRKLKSFLHMAVDEKRHHVIQSCYRDKAVCCFDFTGELIFRFTDPRLRQPGGVALDKCGNVYVCDHFYSNTGSIHKLSPVGELISIIQKGVPICPWAICSDVTGTGFWVTQCHASFDKIVYFRLEQNTEPYHA